MTGLWAAVAAMTGAAVFVVLWSLARSRSSVADPAAGDVAVYRDQIDEIARDRSRGLIDEGEAEAARAEVARRLLAASDRAGEAASDAARYDRRRRIAAVATLVIVPAVALGGYSFLGQPLMPDRPLAARHSAPASQQDVAELIARAESALQRDPNDGRGWAAVAPVFLRLGRAAEAAAAYRNAIRLLGSTPEREADLGEALMAAADGVVTAEAREAFERSVKGEKPALKGSFYLARAAEQDGDVAAAIGRLKPLLADAPPGAPYVDGIKGELERLAGVPALPAPQMSAEQEPKTPEQRMAMVRSMVDGLGVRLTSDGGDVGEWLRLVKARVALGETDKAKDALRAARQKFAADGRAAARLDALALGLGLEGGGA